MKDTLTLTPTETATYLWVSVVADFDLVGKLAAGSAIRGLVRVHGLAEVFGAQVPWQVGSADNAVRIQRVDVHREAGDRTRVHLQRQPQR